MKTQCAASINTIGRHKWHGQTCIARLKAMKDLYVEHNAVNNLLEHITRSLLVAQADEKSNGTLVIAPSGAGKTRFIQHLHLLYPDKISETLTVRPVVHFKVPKSPTPKQMGKAFLKALGDPLFNKGDAEDKMGRIAELLVACDTIVVAIDDFQDVPARRGVAGIQAVGDWVRDIFEMNFKGILLAFGTENAAKVLEFNGQLGRRMNGRMELPVFSMSNPSGVAAFCSLLKHIDAALPLAQTSGLDKPVMAARIFMATAGNFDYIIKLLKRALIRAVEAGRESIDMKDLEAGFVDLHQVAAHNGNPFAANFKGGSLDQPGQVFYKAPSPDSDQDDSGAKKAGKRSRKA